MSRTVVANLLFGWLTLLMAFVLRDADGFVMLDRWIGIQIACWAGALTLLRWRGAVLAPVFLAFCHNLCCFIAVALISHGGIRQADATALLTLLEFGVVAFLVLALRYHSTLLNVAEIRGHQQPDLPLQFHLSWLLVLMLLLALSITLVLSQFVHPGDRWFVLLLIFQGFVWLLTADQLLQFRVRWWLVAAMTLAMLGPWVAYTLFWELDFTALKFFWGRMQMMVLLIVLAYRWAGWRIVPREWPGACWRTRILRQETAKFE